MSTTDVRTYETWMLPQYVKDHFGKPMGLIRLGRDVFIATGPLRTIRFEADDAASARAVIRKHVAYKTETTDKRITRHR